MPIWHSTREDALFVYALSYVILISTFPGQLIGCIQCSVSCLPRAHYSDMISGSLHLRFTLKVTFTYKILIYTYITQMRKIKYIWGEYFVIYLGEDIQIVF